MSIPEDPRHFSQSGVIEPGSIKPKNIVVVGAGLSGVVAAWHMQQQGHQVTVLEKARGAGGRMSTRRTDNGHFDHGAQYFTVRDPQFIRRVEQFIERGLVARWNVPIGVYDGHWRDTKADIARYVATPGMNAICKYFAEQLDVHYGQRVTNIQGKDSEWHVETDNDKTLQADKLILSIPPEQALALLPEPLTALRQKVAAIHMQPCWAILLHGELQLPNNYQAAFINQGPLSWITNNHSKPGRPDTPTAILHATPEWSQQHLEDEHDNVIKQLLDAYQDVSGHQLPKDIEVSAHRWRYALAKQALDAGGSDGALWDATHQIGLCGDWCHGSRVEGAFLSGQRISSLLANTHN